MTDEMVNLKDIQQRLGRCKSLLAKKFGVIDLAIFGSYAGGRQKKNSDVDIYVELKKDFKTFDNFMDLKFFLEEVLARKKVDLVTQESIRREIRSKVFKEAVHV